MEILWSHFIDWVGMRFRPPIILFLIIAWEDNGPQDDIRFRIWFMNLVRIL